MPNKVMALADAVGTLTDGDHIAFGGGGLVRKPLAAVTEVACSHLSDLGLIAFLGGPDVDILVGLDKVRSVHFGYVGLDDLGLAPNFRRAREQDGLEAVEATEFMVLAGLDAAIKGVPFLPTRSGLGTDLLSLPTSPFKVFPCPLTGTDLVAVPALRPDVAFLHVNEADPTGNAFIHGDAFADHLLARAARKVFLTAERIVERPASKGTFISRLWVTGVCEVPGGTGFTSNFPDRPLDRAAAAEYAANAGDQDWLRNFVKDGRSTP
ncbi:CoA transferase subunit A [Streptomyces luteolus]|uniref:CoA-transferase n=1 Tax=Streptomyces luteolus TaxID=3043615 RepID=A0ABT6SPS1_9ACTN|nr:CoA-transferase [Streptomyces sp. B-S-A12]MDI3417606.1 CoA-transferase [Streptomyces sp. B-S-A12]